MDSILDIEMYVYPIEEYLFKQRITKSNEMMIDDSNLVIAYVDMENSSSGAKKSLNYARKKNKEIINLKDIK